MADEEESVFPYNPNHLIHEMTRVQVNEVIEMDMFDDGRVNLGFRKRAGARRQADGKEICIDNPWFSLYDKEIPDLIVALTYYLEHHVKHDV